MLKNTQRDWDRHNKTEYKREEEEDMKQINIHMTAYINSGDKYKTASSVYWKKKLNSYAQTVKFKYFKSKNLF